jgi:hypothetical protein
VLAEVIGWLQAGAWLLGNFDAMLKVLQASRCAGQQAMCKLLKKHMYVPYQQNLVNPVSLVNPV